MANVRDRPAERRADALVDICRRFLDTQSTFTGRLAEQLVPLDSQPLTRLL